MARRARSSTAEGVRDLLLAREQRRLQRWRIPGHVYEVEEALKNGAPIVVSAAVLMATLPGQTFGSGREDELYLLDEHDDLREVAT